MNSFNTLGSFNMIDFLFIIFVSMFIIIIGLKSPDVVCSQIFFLVLCSVYKTHWEASLFNAPEGLCIKRHYLVLKAGKNQAIKLPSAEAILGGNSFITFFQFLLLLFYSIFYFLNMFQLFMCLRFSHLSAHHFPQTFSKLRNASCILIASFLLSSFVFAPHHHITQILKLLLIHHHCCQQKLTLGFLPATMHHKEIFQIHKSQVYRPITYA